MVCRTSLCGVATTLARPSWKPRAVLGILNVSFHRGFLEQKPRTNERLIVHLVPLFSFLFPLLPLPTPLPSLPSHAGIRLFCHCSKIDAPRPLSSLSFHPYAISNSIRRSPTKLNVLVRVFLDQRILIRVKVVDFSILVKVLHKEREKERERLNLMIRIILTKLRLFVNTGSIDGYISIISKLE